MHYCEQEISVQCSFGRNISEGVQWIDMYGEVNTHLTGSDRDYTGCECGLDGRNRFNDNLNDKYTSICNLNLSPQPWADTCT